jgi:hypothetical protein
MVRLRKEDTEDLDVEELDAIEYSTEQFDSYDGEVPPKDIELTGYVRRMWWTRSQAGDPMLKVLWVAAENDGDFDEYNGCPFWLNAALIGAAKFRWAPFLDNFGITLKQIKNNTEVADKDDQNGAPIIKIGNWRPGEENDEAWCRIITNRERYNGEWQPRVGEWLPYDADGDEAEPDDEEPEDDYEEEPEPEPEPEPAPARGRGRTTARTARSAPVASAETPPRRGARTAPATPEKPATGRTGRSTKPAAKAAAPAPARGRGRGRAAAAGYDDEPPF